MNKQRDSKHKYVFLFKKTTKNHPKIPNGSDSHLGPRNLGQYCPIGAGLLMVAMRMYAASGKSVVQWWSGGL